MHRAYVATISRDLGGYTLRADTYRDAKQKFKSAVNKALIDPITTI